MTSLGLIARARRTIAPASTPSGIAVSSVAALDRARSGQLTFCGSAKYASLLADTGASIVLLSPDVAASPTRAPARIVVQKPQEALESAQNQAERVLRPYQ